LAKKRTYREFKQGVYKPLDTKKCLNKTFPIYRSGLERQMMLVLDKNPNVLSWGSENVIIPYYKSVEKRTARYFLDFYIKLQVGELIKEFIIEVKPHSQTEERTYRKGTKASTILYESLTFKTNKDKWLAAQKWCKEQKDKKNRDIEFIIITEKNIATIFGS